MNSRDLIASLVAVLGVYEIIQGLQYAVYLLPFYWHPEALSPAFSSTNATVPVVLGAALIAGRRVLAELLAPNAGDAVSAVPDRLLETLLAVAGVWFTVDALADVAYLATRDRIRFEFDFARELLGQSQQATDAWPERIGVLAKLVLGMGLAVGSRGIAGAIRSLRNAGRRPAADPPDAGAD